MLKRPKIINEKTVPRILNKTNKNIHHHAVVTVME